MSAGAKGFSRTRLLQFLESFKDFEGDTVEVESEDWAPVAESFCDDRRWPAEFAPALQAALAAAFKLGRTVQAQESENETRELRGRVRQLEYTHSCMMEAFGKDRFEVGLEVSPSMMYGRKITTTTTINEALLVTKHKSEVWRFVIPQVVQYLERTLVEIANADGDSSKVGLLERVAIPVMDPMDPSDFIPGGER
jgi:hypothetical protein